MQLQFERPVRVSIRCVYSSTGTTVQYGADYMRSTMHMYHITCCFSDDHP